MSWFILATINNGYPYNTDFPMTYNTDYTSNDDVKYPYTAWRIQNNINSGYPFTWYMFPEEGGGSSGGEIDYNVSDFGDLDNRQTILDQMFHFDLFQHGAIAYALNGSELADVLQQINVLYNADPDTVQMQLDFHGSNPTDYIINVFGFPFNFDSEILIPSPVKIGPVTLDTSGYEIGQIFIINFGTLHIDPYFNDFRDYKPYTELQLYLPLCGTVSLDPALYIGHDLSVDYVCNIYTGSCIARIYRDSLLDSVVNGNIACQIPITAAKMGDYQANIKAINSAIKQQETSLILSSVTTTAAIAGGIMSGNPLALAGAVGSIGQMAKSITNLDKLYYDMSHNAPGISSTSSGDAVLSMNASTLKALLMYKRTQVVQGFNPDHYGHTVGYACCKQCLVSDITGYTVCSKINTNGIQATTEEINMIEQLFKSGVYL